ncbi:MAG: hypothetical protein LBL44_07365 [Treponema sp.]|jgi:hypothetical protein|nr:hypothetical protein [Treponema sp.]
MTIHREGFRVKTRAGFRTRLVIAGILFFSAAGSFSQDEAVSAPESVLQEEENGTIPDELRRPRRGEDPRYPEDMVIGELGRGKAPEEAWRLAENLLSALVMQDRSGLSSIDSLILDNLLGTLGEIDARTFRLGSGRDEPDGSVSFLVRFMGREEWIAGELYLRLPETQESRPDASVPEVSAPEASAAEAGETVETAETPEEPAAEPAGVTAAGIAVWHFDDLLLEEKRSRGAEKDFSLDFSPYERFF